MDAIIDKFILDDRKPKGKNSSGSCHSYRENTQKPFSSANIFYIQERIGTIQALKDAARKGLIHIRILTPKDEYIQQRLQKLKKKDGFDAQYFTSNSDIRTKTLIIDRRESLVTEIKEQEDKEEEIFSSIK